jgi:hypothetical protein
VDVNWKQIAGTDLAAPAADNADALAAVAAGVMRMLVANLLYNGATFDRERTPSVFKPFASTAITAGTGTTIWTPAAGKKFRLMGYAISSSVAGQLIFGDNAVGTVIARSPAVAAAGIATDGGSWRNGILSAAANNVLKLDGPTGNVAGMVWGTEE